MVSNLLNTYCLSYTTNDALTLVQTNENDCYCSGRVIVGCATQNFLSHIILVFVLDEILLEPRYLIDVDFLNNSK